MHSPRLAAGQPSTVHNRQFHFWQNFVLWIVWVLAVYILDADQFARFATGVDSTLPEIGVVTGLLILLPLLMAMFDGPHAYPALTPAEREEESVCKKVWQAIRGQTLLIFSAGLLAAGIVALRNGATSKSVEWFIAAGLAKNFPQHQQVLEKNLKAYLGELDSWISRWDKAAAPLRGVKYVEYHPEWVYLAERFGMKRIGAVKLKPGVEPTPNHIVELSQQIKQEKAQLLLYGAQNPRLPKQIANETGIRALRLYSGGGGLPETDTYIKWIDYTVKTLIQTVS
jgi:hypothetical protein